MKHVPHVAATIERRLLVNYRVDPGALQRVIPAGFRPHLVNGVGVAGICLIRLGQLRPVGLPDFLGLTTCLLYTSEGQGFYIAMHTLDRSRPAIGAQAVGIAQGALDYALGYVQHREQFGKPIAEFQGLQFMLADMAMLSLIHI